MEQSKLSSNEKLTLTEYANINFRSVADNDYIAARVLYKLELDLQFLWYAHQSIEKYLKAILLYNFKPFKKPTHRLDLIYNAIVKMVKEIKFFIPPDVEQFISYINNFGTNRYFCTPFYIDVKALYNLDKTVWHIRRYCFNYRKEGLFDKYINMIHDEKYKESPKKFRLPGGGVLEKIIDGCKKSDIRKQLLYNNYYYGKNNKKINPKIIRMSAANPSHCLGIDAVSKLKILRDYVFIDKKVQE